MTRRVTRGFFVCLALAVATAAAVASCSSSSPTNGLAAVCAINSDCNSPLICAFGRCHIACTESRDCSSGERCVSAGTGGVCQLAQESTCSATSPCGSSTLVCASQQCRTACQPAATQATTCLKNQTCVADPSVSTAPGACFDLVELDGGSLDGATSGTDGSGASDTGGGSHDASGDASDAGPPGNACPSAQTQFGNVAQGDSNPAFLSGVGARTASGLIVFDTYDGVDPAGDGGGNNVGIVYAQTFDPQSGASKGGSAQPLFTAPNLAVPAHTAMNGGAGQFYLYSAAVAPAGQIVVLYSTRFYLSGSYDDGYALYAAFLDSSGDAGAAGLSLQKVVLLETAVFGGQPHAVWSNSSQAFVLSWQYVASNAWFVTVQKYLPDGRPAGGSTQVVPTNDPTSAIYGAGNYESSSVGESGDLFGVAYKSSGVLGHYDPGLTILDGLGHPVGPTVDVLLPAPHQDSVWMTVAGTAQGFVYFYDRLTPAAVTEVFVPVSPDAGAIGGDLDGGDAGGFPTFSFPGAVRANAARAIGDSMGGAGGVGLALLYPNGVSFAYVNPDGVGYQGPNSVFAHNYGSGDEVSMTTYQGSFVVSLYNAAGHSTQVAASGCAH